MSDDEGDERPIHTNDPLSRLLWAANALHEHKGQVEETTALDDDLVECIDDLVAAAHDAVELVDVTRSLTANLREDWTRTASRNSANGWPPFADVVSFPTDFAKHLGYVLVALDGGATTEKLHGMGVSRLSALGVRLRLLTGEDVPISDQRRALPEVDEREAAKHRVGCPAGERFRGVAKCCCDGRAHLDPKPLELVPLPAPALELVDLRRPRTGPGGGR